jgi:hypothetical protein
MRIRGQFNSYIIYEPLLKLECSASNIDTDFDTCNNVNPGKIDLD